MIREIKTGVVGDIFVDSAQMQRFERGETEIVVVLETHKELGREVFEFLWLSTDILVYD